MRCCKRKDAGTQNVRKEGRTGRYESAEGWQKLQKTDRRRAKENQRQDWERQGKDWEMWI